LSDGIKFNFVPLVDLLHDVEACTENTIVKNMNVLESSAVIVEKKIAKSIAS